MSRLLGNQERGSLFVISAPAGTGKTTLARMLCNEFPCIKESVSCTTRPIRAGEIEGYDYHFLSHQKFQSMIEAGEFLEYAEVFGHFYGTLKSTVEKELVRGHHVILVIDTQGALKLKSHVPATFIFVSPPTLEELRARLIKRKTETSETIKHRLSWAEKEMTMKDHYDYHIINDNLMIAYGVLRSILIAEEHKIKRK